jgi:putative oxidoreductase
MKKTINYYNAVLDKITDLPLLLIRLTLAYGFYEPAKLKLTGIDGIVSWFTEMGLPFPILNAYIATATECIGVVCLIMGLGMRYITIPLIITMLVAIKTVHWENGFAAGENGFEIPFYYIVFLITLLIYGGGKWSLDNLIFQKKTE